MAASSEQKPKDTREERLSRLKPPSATSLKELFGDNNSDDEADPVPPTLPYAPGCPATLLDDTVPNDSPPESPAKKQKTSEHKSGDATDESDDERHHKFADHIATKMYYNIYCSVYDQLQHCKSKKSCARSRIYCSAFVCCSRCHPERRIAIQGLKSQVHHKLDKMVGDDGREDGGGMNPASGSSSGKDKVGV